MHVPARLGKERWDVAHIALRGPIEDGAASVGGSRVKGAWWRRRRRNSELVEVQRRQLRGNQVGVIAYIAETRSRRHWEAVRIVQPGVIEGAYAVHLQISHEVVPVGYRS